MTGASSFFDSHCIDCPPHSTAVFGSSDVTNCTCNAGFTGPNGGHCVPCTVAQYKDTLGSAACHSCPPNTWSSTRSTDIRDCQPLPAPFVSEVRQLYVYTHRHTKGFYTLASPPLLSWYLCIFQHVWVRQHVWIQQVVVRMCACADEWMHVCEKTRRCARNLQSRIGIIPTGDIAEWYGRGTSCMKDTKTGRSHGIMAPWIVERGQACLRHTSV